MKHMRTIRVLLYALAAIVVTRQADASIIIGSNSYVGAIADDGADGFLFSSTSIFVSPTLPGSGAVAVSKGNDQVEAEYVSTQDDQQSTFDVHFEHITVFQSDSYATWFFTALEDMHYNYSAELDWSDLGSDYRSAYFYVQLWDDTVGVAVDEFSTGEALGSGSLSRASSGNLIGGHNYAMAFGAVSRQGFGYPYPELPAAAASGEFHFMVSDLSAVPEPSSMALAAIGGIGAAVGAYRRRGRRG